MEKALSSNERLRIVEAEIEKAKLEAGVYERQLKDLLPDRQRIEKECFDNYGCDIKELPAYIEKTEKEFNILVEQLEKDVKDAQENNIEQ